MKSHHDLKVWHASIQLAISVYGLTRKFPDEERYGLTSQIRRAAISIASNIAEGSARQGTKEFIHFLYMAVGSANELDIHAEIGRRGDCHLRRSGFGSAGHGAGTQDGSWADSLAEIQNSTSLAPPGASH